MKRSVRISNTDDRCHKVQRHCCNGATLQIVLLVVVATFVSAFDPALVQEAERDILIKLFNETLGTQWTRKENWNDPQVHYCEWQGVACIGVESNSRRRRALQNDDARRVQSINLAENNLQGSVPLSLLLLLPSIQSIQLNGNNVDFLKYAEQEKAVLGRSLDAVGTTTGVTLSSQIHHLDVSHTSVASLQRLFSAGSGLTPIETPQLTSFYASQARLQGSLSEWLGGTSATLLERLSLDHNGLTGQLPASIGNLHKLKYWNLADNDISGPIPDTVNQFSKIRYFLMESNRLTGTVPTGLADDEYTPLLEQLDLSAQRHDGTIGGLTGPLPAFGTQKFLRRIDLGENALTGTIPSTLLVATNDMEDFDFVILRSNQLEGSVPQEVLQRVPVDSLLIQDNQILSVSSCPSDWEYGCNSLLCPPLFYEPRSGRQEELNRPCLPCDENKAYWGQTTCEVTDAVSPVETPSPTASPTLSNFGTIDEQAILSEFYVATGGDDWVHNEGWSDPRDADAFCTWFGVVCVSESNRSVKYLQLNANNLLGVTTSSLWKLSNLQQLDLSHNDDLSVSFDGISQAKAMRSIDVSSTKVTSTSGLEAAVDTLEELNLSGALASSVLPSEIFSLTNLKQVTMDYNNAQGMLGEDVGKLTKLITFSASNNELVGQLPQSLSALTDLATLRLATNHFSGPLPPGLTLMTSLSILDLSNQWSNGMDDDFSDIGMSGFTGTLPNFAGFSQLRRLSLGVNSFTGTVPVDFLPDIDSDMFDFADLSENFLTGEVAASLSHIPRLYLDQNQIIGVDQEVCDALPVELLPFGCDAFLCAPGFYNSAGRQTGPDKPCISCEMVDGAMYYGSIVCGGQEEILSTAPSYAPFEDEPAVRLALKSIFNSCNGDSWSSKQNWMNDNISLCSWAGIGCSENGFVDEISLRSVGLTGTFPSLSVFESIPELESLVLDGNDVIFPFAGIARARKLRTLDLSHMELESIDGIETATSLESLYLSNNNLKGIFPGGLLALTSLTRLSIAFNSFSGTIPSDVRGLSRLEYLALHDNDLEGLLPTTLGEMTSLQFFLAQSNNFDGKIPTELNLLVNLRYVDLSDQRSDEALIGSLPSFATCKQLKRVDISRNALSGSIPPNFLDSVDPTSFEHVDLSDNYLEGTMPANLAKFDVSIYDFTNNYITGLDDALCDVGLGGIVTSYGCDAVLCQPGTYSVLGRQMTDTTVCESCPGNLYFGQTECGDDAEETEAPVASPTLSDAQILSKFYESLNGNSWIRKDHWKQSEVRVCQWYGVTCSKDGAHKVVSIQLSRNNLKGRVPKEIFNLPYLESLSLATNSIYMEDLSSIGMARQLKVLDLSNTAIDDINGIGNALALSELHIKSNALTGAFPEELFKLTELEQLDFDFNSFSGQIGDGVGMLSNLKLLTGEKNRLTGSLRTEMGKMTSLVTLRLSRNDMSGEMPTELNMMTDLSFLDLSFQTEYGNVGLSGPLPSFEGLSQIRRLQLKSNALSGGVPENFLKGASPEVFEWADLSSNGLVGRPPAALARLHHIHLQDNFMTGVPVAFCNESRGDIYRRYGCNAVLCPPQTFNVHGRQESDVITCQACPEATFWGTTACPPSYVNPEATLPPGAPVVDERDVLVNFYQTCGGNDWNDNRGWLSTNSICEWEGIRCADGRNRDTVEAIDLGANNIVGIPPTELYSLPSLRTFAIYSNPLDGIDFHGIEYAVKLRELLIDATGVSSIRGLDLAPGLEVLNLRFNKLSGQFPTEVAKLRSLHTLSVAYNELEGTLPSFLEDLTNLRSLLLSTNQIGGDLRLVNFPGSLRRLDISQNRISGSIPNSFLTLIPFTASLEVDLSDNELTGSVPTDLTRFNSLNIFLRDNRLTELDTVLCGKTTWNEGDVGKYGCNAILCPAGYAAPNGRHSSSGECSRCPNSGGAPNMGASTCVVPASGAGSVTPTTMMLAVIVAVSVWLLRD